MPHLKEVSQQLPDPALHLRPGQTMAALAAEPLRISDTESARRMPQAKRTLVSSFYLEARPA